MTARFARMASVAAPLAAVALLAACGSSGGSDSGAAGAPGSGAAASTASGVTVSTASGPDGTYLTDGSGRALYLWVADTGSTSTCSGACASAWPPLTATGTPAAGSGVDAADLGTSSRSDGTKQVTYDGHPLYYFAGDGGAGQTEGQGSDGFGAKWWLVAPSGAAITGAAPAPSATTGAGGGYHY